MLLHTTKRLMVYDTEWQAIRVGTLAVNRSDGGWATVQGAANNLHTLTQYLESVGMGNFDEMQRRLYRIINMLNATRMGYSGQGLEDSEQDQMVREARNRFQDAANTALDFNGDNWLLSIDEMRQNERLALMNLDTETRSAIYSNLRSRLDKHSKSKFRGELRWYVALIEEVEAEILF